MSRISQSIVDRGSSTSGGGASTDTGNEFDADCPSGVSVRDVVYLSAAGTVDKANASDNTKAPAIGIVVAKTTPTRCTVRKSGSIGGFSDLTPRAVYYLDKLDGAMISAPGPTQPAVFQKLGQATSDSVFEANVDPTTFDMT